MKRALNELDRFYGQARKLSYNFGNYDSACEKRMKKVDSGEWTSEQWLNAERQAARRFVLRIARMIESFEVATPPANSQPPFEAQGKDGRK